MTTRNPPSDTAGSSPRVLGRVDRGVNAILGSISTGVSILSGLLFLVMTGLVVTQVFYRYALNSPLTGSEEAARIAMIYVVMVGAAICIRHHSHMAVTYFRNRLPLALARASDIAVALGIAAFALILIFKGIEFAERASFMKTPALQISRSYVIWAFPIGGALMLLFVIEDTVRALTGRRLPQVDAEGEL